MMGLTFPFLLKFGHLANDSAQLFSVISDCLERYSALNEQFENLFLLWARSLRNATHIVEAYQILENDQKLDGVVATTYNKSVFSGMLVNEDGLLEPLFLKSLERRTEQPTVVVDNSSMVWNRVESFESIKLGCHQS